LDSMRLSSFGVDPKDAQRLMRLASGNLFARATHVSPARWGVEEGSEARDGPTVVIISSADLRRT